MSSTEGLRCRRAVSCGRFAFRELDAAIVADPDRPGRLVWRWICPKCGGEIYRQPFAYPPDMPALELVVPVDDETAAMFSDVVAAEG